MLLLGWRHTHILHRSKLPMTYKNGSDQGFLNLIAAKTSNHGLRKSSNHPSTLSYKVVGVPIPLAYRAIYRGRSGSRSSVHHARRERQRLESLEVPARLSEGDELLEERRGGGVVDRQSQKRACPTL